MDEFKELIETYKDMKENELLIEMPNMRKDKVDLPVNLWLDDGDRTNGLHDSRIKFQNDYDFHMNKNNLIPIELRTCEVPDDWKPYVKIRISDVNQVRNFVYNNYYALTILDDKLAFADEIKPFFVKGGRINNEKKTEKEEEVKEFLRNRGIKPPHVEPIPEPKKNIIERKSQFYPKAQKPNFVREEYNPESPSEDTMFFRTLPSEFTGLPMTIWIDEGATYKDSNRNLRIKMNGNYERRPKDRNDIFEVDMNGNIYSCSEENEERYMIEDEDFQAVKNFLKNNEYALQKIADDEIDYSVIAYYMINGGEIASEEEKEKLKRMTDYLSFDAGNYEEYVKKNEDRLI